MNRVFIFLFMIAISFAACNSSADNNDANADENTEKKAQNDGATNNSSATNEAEGYTTTIITPDIPSPRKEMTATMGDQTITINYGSPSVKGRTIFGELEAYDKVWRTGANGATTFEASTDLKVQGETLAAGKYGLFTIPKEDGNWTVIFNSVADQWGAYDYDINKDVLRVNATAETRDEVAETMEFVMESGNLVFKWNKTALPLKVEL